MRVEKDFEEFLIFLNKYKVKYCIIGGFAVAYHGRPRYTEDIDILVYPTKENSKRVKLAMKEFGIGVSDLEDDYFATKGNFYQIGVAPVMIHIVNDITGVDLNVVFRKRVKSKYGKTTAYFIGIDELIKNKLSTGRFLDKTDAEILIKCKEAVDSSLRRYK